MTLSWLGDIFFQLSGGVYVSKISTQIVLSFIWLHIRINVFLLEMFVVFLIRLQLKRLGVNAVMKLLFLLELK